MKKYKLYGDGIHDDTDALQELIDSGACEVSLPVPENHYLISRPLTIPSNFKLKLPRYARIKLADGSNCFMISNKIVEKPASRLDDSLDPFDRFFFGHYDRFSPDEEDICHDFEIEGGIWDFNNKNQKPNPYKTHEIHEDGYVGYMMLFYNAKNFRLSNMTIKDTVNFAIVIDKSSYFTVENITFDLNLGNPTPNNMDGVHLNGNCHYGVIRNLKGACYDDLVALNAHEGSCGDITNIEIDGVFAEGCHSAVRLLSVGEKVEHINISNVYGSYYQYCVGFTKYYPGETTGHFDAITLSNIHASKAERLPTHWEYDPDYHFPFIWMQDETVIKNLSIEHLHRREFVNPIETIRIDETALVNNLLISDLTLENHTGKECAKLRNLGKVDKLTTIGLPRGEGDNKGTIDVWNEY